MFLNKRLIRHSLLAALFILILPSFLEAQQSRPGHRMIRMSWTSDNYALYYEVTIDADIQGRYRNVEQLTTETPSINISLQVGKYRIQVIPYDYLEKPGTGSQWVMFEVRSAGLPEPPPVTVAEAKEEPEIIIDYIEEEPFDMSGDESEEVFAEEPVIRAPKEPKILPFSIYAGGAWKPVIPVYGIPDPFFGEKDKKISVAGAGLGFGFLFTQLNFIKPGVELSASWYLFDQNTFTAGLNIFAQKDFGSRTALRLHFGGGLTILDGGINWNTQVSMAWLFYPIPRLYIEAGIDYMHIFSGQLPGDHPGAIRPIIGIGWHFF